MTDWRSIDPTLRKASEQVAREDDAVTEACEPLTPRQELEGYLAMADDSVEGARRVLREAGIEWNRVAVGTDEHAEYEKMQAMEGTAIPVINGDEGNDVVIHATVRYEGPCEHLPEDQINLGDGDLWCKSCGALYGNKWRLPERATNNP